MLYNLLPALPSYRLPYPMIRAPNTPHTLIPTPHRLRHSPQLLPTRIPQQLRLLQNLLLLQIPYTHGLFAPVDVRAFYERVFVRTRGDGDFDLGVRGGEGWERVF